MTDPTLSRNELTAELAVAFFKRKWPGAKRQLDEMDPKTIRDMYLLAGDALRLCEQNIGALIAGGMVPVEVPEKEKPNWEEFVRAPGDDLALADKLHPVAAEPETEDGPLFASDEETDDELIPF